MAEAMPELPKNDTADGRATNLRRGRMVLFPGTDAETLVETAIHEVKPGGSGKYVATVITNIGCDDALALRAKAGGQEPYIPIWKRVADKHAKGQKVRRVADGPDIPVAATAPVAETAPLLVPGSVQELAVQLAPFENDNEMVSIITKRWQKRRDAIAEAALKQADKMVSTAKTAAPELVEA